MDKAFKNYQKKELNLKTRKKTTVFRHENIHPESYDFEDLPDYLSKYKSDPLLVELFCGAGGLSIGLMEGGFRPALSVDNNSNSLDTHKAYFPGATVNQDLGIFEIVDYLTEPFLDVEVSLLAGGPPCQPFSKANRYIRSTNKEGTGSLSDHRRDLWEYFLYATKRIRPLTVLIENVPDIATNEDGVILRKIISNLEREGYLVDCRSFFAYDFGVPQIRQRIFIVGTLLHVDDFEWPEILSENERPTLRDAISDLPTVEPGWDEKAGEYKGPITEYQKSMRKGVTVKDSDKVYEHFTRRVRPDDLEAFKLLTQGMKYSDLPQENRRYSTESFTDKYNRLDFDKQCRTLTAHMSKDSYWYIHPEQQRTLTVREAARVMSFPDWFRFSGSQATGFHQIGEAVCPFVGRALGKSLFEHIQKNKKVSIVSSASNKNEEIRGKLVEWYKNHGAINSSSPWEAESDIWLIFLGMTIFEKKTQKKYAKTYWPNIKRTWGTAKNFLTDEYNKKRLETYKSVEDFERIESFANLIIEKERPEKPDLLSLGFKKSSVDHLFAILSLSGKRPLNFNIERLSSRIMKREIGIRNTVNRQIAISLFIGEDGDGKVYRASSEYAKTICQNNDPSCLVCVIQKECKYFNSI